MEPPHTWTARVAVLGKVVEDTLPGEWEDIKDKLLHLYGIGFAGIDPIATGVHKRHFFNRNMLFQPLLELPVRLEKKNRSLRGRQPLQDRRVLVPARTIRL